MNVGNGSRRGVGKTTSKTVETLRGSKLVNGERILPISRGGRGVITDVVNTAGAARSALFALLTLFARSFLGTFSSLGGAWGIRQGRMVGRGVAASFLYLYMRTHVRCYQVGRKSQEVS